MTEARDDQRERIGMVPGASTFALCVLRFAF